MHEGHRPALNDRLWYRQRLGLLTHYAVARLDSQVQLQFPIDPVHPLVIPAMTFHVAQVQEAQAELPVALVVRKPNQVVGDLGIFRGPPRLVAIPLFIMKKPMATRTMPPLWAARPKIAQLAKRETSHIFPS